MISKALLTMRLYAVTLSYLKLSQIIYRFMSPLRYVKIGIVKYRRRKISFREVTENKVWFPDKECSFDGVYFTFLNQSVSSQNLCWNSVIPSTLWAYNLNYFDWINSHQSVKFKGEITHLMFDWIERNKIGEKISWDPYPTSLRIVNIIKYFLRKGTKPSPLVAKSIYLQADWLNLNIEWHLRGNHVFANCKALIFFGLYFSGSFPSRILISAEKLLLDQFGEQVLADGGHYELSPMYHNIIIEDLIDLLHMYKLMGENFSRHVKEKLQEKILSMLDWSKLMSHSDGDLSYFNDAVAGIACRHNALVKYASDVGLRGSIRALSNKLQHLERTGYVRYQHNDVVFIMDVGEIGPTFQPGHGHADILSFELSVADQRLFVNSGVSEYSVVSGLRLEERSTRSHNTVTINEMNSSEVWSAFRVARRASPFDLCIVETEDTCYIKCSHDGYRRLPGLPVHTRQVVINKNNFVFKDYIKGSFLTASAYYQLHPKLVVNSVENNKYQIFAAGSIVAEVIIHEGNVSIIKSFYCYEFGKRVSTNALRVDFSKNNVNVEIRII